MATLENLVDPNHGEPCLDPMDPAAQDELARLRHEHEELQRALSESDSLKDALATELQDMWRIHEMNTRLAEVRDLPRILQEILDAAIALQDADFGNIQLYDPATETLKIVAHRGFSKRFLDRFERVDAADNTACGRSLRTRARVVIEDVEKDETYAPYRAIAAEAGYRAVQSTPLFGRSGVVNGILSTHFREPHLISRRELRLTDLYLCLASEMIERAQIKEALRAARQAADDANRAKDRFLATASHDLRQPLQTLYFLSQVLRRLINDSDLGEVIDAQEKAIAAMSELLNALLDISKLASGAVKPQINDVPLAPVFDELRVEFSPITQTKGLRFETGVCTAIARTDPTLLSQILRNLLSNAIRYTRRGCVRLSCEHEGDLIRIDVEDTGIGIPEEYLPRIFEEFFQVGVSPNSVREGSGLGLSIVRRLVRLLNLHMRVHSQVGSGSVFSIVLPASSAISD